MPTYNIVFGGLPNAAGYSTSLITASSEDTEAPASRLVTEQVTETFRMPTLLSGGGSWIEIDHGTQKFDENGWPLWRQAIGGLMSHSGTRAAKWRYSCGPTSLADKTLPLTGYDSGWLNCFGSFTDLGRGRWSGQVPVRGDTSPKNVAHVLPTNPDDPLGNWDMRYVRMHWDDAANPVGSSDFGQVVTGPAYFPSVGMAQGYTPGREPDTAVRMSTGNQTHKRRRQEFRVINFKVDHIPQQEALNMLYHYIGLWAGTHRNFLLVLFPSMTEQYGNLAWWGRLRKQSGVDNSAGVIHAKGFDFAEVL